MRSSALKLANLGLFLNSSRVNKAFIGSYNSFLNLSKGGSNIFPIIKTFPLFKTTAGNIPPLETYEKPNGVEVVSLKVLFLGLNLYKKLQITAKDFCKNNFLENYFNIEGEKYTPKKVFLHDKYRKERFTKEFILDYVTSATKIIEKRSDKICMILEENMKKI